RLAALDELDLDRHADLDLVGRAIHDVRHQTQTGLLVELDHGDHERHLEAGNPGLPVDRVRVHGPAAADCSRGDVVAPALRAARGGGVEVVAAVAAPRDAQLALGAPRPER